VVREDLLKRVVFDSQSVSVGAQEARGTSQSAWEPKRPEAQVSQRGSARELERISQRGSPRGPRHKSVRVRAEKTVSQQILVSNPIWDSWLDIYYCLTVTVFFFVGRPLWREDRSVILHAAGPYQRSLSRVRVPWDSRLYFTVSELRHFSVASYDSQWLFSTEFFLIIALHGPRRRHSLCC
jgi:hypothetical protein